MKCFSVIVSVLLFFSCSNDEEISYDSLVENVFLNQRGVTQANGSDRINGAIIFKDGANPDKIQSKISLINGTFIDPISDEFIVVPEQNPEISPEDLWKDEFTIQTTTVAFRLFVEVDVNGYTRRYPIDVEPSLTSSISLSTSASSAPINFLGEVTIVGSLRNEESKKVSNGAKVQFRDVLSNGQPANGNFRSLQTITGPDSSVMAVYSPGLIEPNQFITIISEVFDRQGNLTEISDSVDIWVYPL